MTVTTPTERGRNGKTALLTAQLREEIARGHRPPGEQLPSFAEMRRLHGVAPLTTDRIYSQLEREGLIVRENGRGVFVRQKRARTGVIGFTGARPQPGLQHRSLYFGPLLEGIQDEAFDSGYEVLLLRPDSHISWEKMDGAIVSFDFSGEIASRFPLGMPFVALLVKWDDAPCILSEDYPAMRDLTDHLLELGHRRICLLTEGLYYAEERRRAYRDSLEAAGVAPSGSWMRHLNGSPGGGGFENLGYQRMCEWLEDGWADLGCTAIMAYNDDTAYGVIRALREAGYSVPGDVSVTGFDGIVTMPGRPHLTTASVPLRELGQAAFASLRGWMETDNVPRTRGLRPHFVAGQTTAPPHTV